MAGEVSSGPAVSKGLTTDREVTTDTIDALDAGQVDMVEELPWWLCKDEEDSDVWCAYVKGYVGFMKWALQ